MMAEPMPLLIPSLHVTYMLRQSAITYKRSRSLGAGLSGGPSNKRHEPDLFEIRNVNANLER